LYGIKSDPHQKDFRTASKLTKHWKYQKLSRFNHQHKEQGKENTQEKRKKKKPKKRKAVQQAH